MWNWVGKGKRVWKKICANTSPNTLFYVFPEKDEHIFESAKRHMNTYGLNRNLVIICVEEMPLPDIGQVKCVKLSAQQMEYLLIYLRSCRDVLLNMNLDNVFVLSFKEVGGNSLQKLYEENIYEEEFLIKQWLLPDLDKPGKWRN